MEEANLVTKLSRLNYDQPTAFCEVFGEEGSDKGNKEIAKSWHNFSVVYHHLFNNLQSQSEDKKNSLSIFEMGIGSVNPSIPSNMKHYQRYRPGASLRAWKQIFPHAKVMGADIDKGCLYQSEQVSTFYCDQTDVKSIRELWAKEELQNVQFDIFIDDGLHTFDANQTLFLETFHKIKSETGGTYVIEDISVHDRPKWISQIEKWQKQEPFKGFTFSLLDVPSRVNCYDNRLLIIQRTGNSSEPKLKTETAKINET